jgi:hypothetical protein
MLENGNVAMPAPTDGSSTVRLTALAAWALTVIVTFCSARGDPSATPRTLNP